MVRSRIQLSALAASATLFAACSLTPAPADVAGGIAFDGRHGGADGERRRFPSFPAGRQNR